MTAGVPAQPDAFNGVLIVDKPAGFTSFDVVAVVRGLTRQKKIGHTGTLDPMATGVLPLLLGTAAKAESLLPDTDKAYEADFQLGVETDTQDSTGTVLRESGRPASRGQVEAALRRFQGELMQLPPMYSAVRQNGKRLYELAREGKVVERSPRPVFIREARLLEYDALDRRGRLFLACSKGTYVRSVIADLGAALGTFGMMAGLRRTRACGFTLDDAQPLERLREAGAEYTAGCLLPVDRLFACLPAVAVTGPQARRFCNGGGLALERTSLSGGCQAGERVRVYGVINNGVVNNSVINNGGAVSGPEPERAFLGLGEVDAAGEELSVCKLFCTVVQARGKAANTMAPG